MKALLDTNILIDLTRRRRSVAEFFEREGITEGCISIAAAIEYLGGEKLRRKADARKFLKEFTVLDMSAATGRRALQWASKHEFGASRTCDFLIAATAVQHKLPLATANIKDVIGLEGLRLIWYNPG